MMDIDGYSYFDGLLMVPSGNQTWLAGKWTIEIGDVPS